MSGKEKKSVLSALEETKNSYVSALALMLSDDQVSLSNLIDFRDAMLRNAESECENAKAYAEELKKIRMAGITVEFEIAISRFNNRLARLAALRDSIDDYTPAAIDTIKNPPESESALSSKLPEFDEKDLLLVKSLAPRKEDTQES